MKPITFAIISLIIAPIFTFYAHQRLVYFIIIICFWLVSTWWTSVVYTFFVWCNVEYKSLLQLYLGYMTWFSLPLWGTSELPIYSKSQKKMLPVFFSSKIKPYYHAPKMVKNITKNASMCMMAKLCTATAHFAALFAIKGDITSFQTVSTIKTSETTW